MVVLNMLLIGRSERECRTAGQRTFRTDFCSKYHPFGAIRLWPLLMFICVVNRDGFQLPSSGWTRIFVGGWDGFRYLNGPAITIRVLA
jgi:hypothetical protein